MRLTETKRMMIYKNSVGGIIKAVISLPKTEEKSVLSEFYESLIECYFNAAKDFISRAEDTSFYTLHVKFEYEVGEKNIKIKRLSEISISGKTLRRKNTTDTFTLPALELKN